MHRVKTQDTQHPAPRHVNIMHPPAYLFSISRVPAPTSPSPTIQIITINDDNSPTCCPSRPLFFVNALPPLGVTVLGPRPVQCQTFNMFNRPRHNRCSVLHDHHVTTMLSYRDPAPRLAEDRPWHDHAMLVVSDSPYLPEVTLTLPLTVALLTFTIPPLAFQGQLRPVQFIFRPSRPADQIVRDVDEDGLRSDYTDTFVLSFMAMMAVAVSVAVAVDKDILRPSVPVSFPLTVALPAW